jgi:hypothetical protein
MQTVTIEPLAPAGRSCKKTSDGFPTGTSPAPVISNTPISFAAPNRFFVAGFTASYIPHFAVDETSSQVQDAWKFGFFAHYYLSLWDFD